MGIPLFLSGNFGELRSNHFHTGLDIKTDGVEGKRIYASADGFVSRIKKSPWGYGNVLYVDHPSGHTTVYAHLSKFNDEIEAYYRKVQFKKEKFAVDLYPGEQALPVKKGDIIAYSGNSGMSGGPHLHYEIRETESEKPLNPMLFGFDIRDNIPPRVQGIRIYQFPNDSLAGICNRSHVVTGSGQSCRLKNGDLLELNGYGTYGLAVHSTDMLNGSGNICGIFISKLYLDGELIFEQRTDTLDFYTNRYMNSHTDYALYRETKKSYHKSFIAPNDKLPIYKFHKNKGLFKINDLEPHTVKYEIYDVSGNLSVLNFRIQNKSDRPMPGAKSLTQAIDCCVASEVNYDAASFFFPAGTVYNNTPVSYSSSKGETWMYSDLHTINNTDIPVQQYYYVKIKSNVPKRLGGKALVVERDGGRYYTRGGEYEDGWVTGRARNFGTFLVLLDTIAPVINFSNVYDGRRFSGNQMHINAGDNLSGVKDYDAYINGNWAPAEYNSKKTRYELNLKGLDIPAGKNELRFEAVDERGNRSSQTVSFIR